MISDHLRSFFLLRDYGTEFHLWSGVHLLASILFAVLPIAFVIVFAKRIRSLKHERLLGACIGAFGLAVEFTQYFWHYYGGETDWRLIYPTTLCGLTLYISSLAMITRSGILSKIAYFYCYGAFFSFLFADISHGYDRFRFYAYFIIHGLILFNAAYLVAVRGVRADRRGLAAACALLVPVLALSFLFNGLFSDSAVTMNFFYINDPPFEFPVFSQLYAVSRYLYAAAACVSYFLLILILYGLAKILKIDRPAAQEKLRGPSGVPEP